MHLQRLAGGELPFRTSRICAFFGVRIGSFSNGYIADGRIPPVAAAPSGRITGEENLPEARGTYRVA